MSIHIQDIETLLEAYTTKHQAGAIKASGNLIPHVVKALIALIEEKTSGQPVPSTLEKPAAPSPAPAPAPAVDPLAVIGDTFFVKPVEAVEFIALPETVVVAPEPAPVVETPTAEIVEETAPVVEAETPSEEPATAEPAEAAAPAPAETKKPQSRKSSAKRA